MPVKVTPENAKEKWNFYFPIGLKLQMHQKLLRLGQQKSQSALLRALIRMFVNGDVDEDKLLLLIEEEIYIKQDGSASTL